MKRIIFVFLTLLVSILCSEMHAQTFQITDFELPADASSRERRKCEEQLGVIVKLEEFDKCAKLNIDGENNQSIVFYLQYDGLYSIEDRNQKCILTIEKTMGYYRSLKFTVWENHTWKGTVIMKRK